MYNKEKQNREQKFSLSCNIGNKGPQMRVAWGKFRTIERAYFSSSCNLTLDFSATEIL